MALVLLHFVILFPFFYRENLLKVEIYYDELSYDLIEQVPSYDLKILLGRSL